MSDTKPKLPSATMSGNNGNKTFSKNLLYMPLVAYDTKDGHGEPDPDAYMASRKSMPKSVVEKSLTEFWHKVGVDYHRNLATVHDSKNNGNRPSSLAEMEERIRQRVLVLIGGGINSTLTTNTQQRRNESTATAANRKTRKRRRKTAMNVSTDHSRTEEFLQQLNGLWNEYIHKLFYLQPPATSAVTDSSTSNNNSSSLYQALTRKTSFWARVTHYISYEKAQLVGAKVRIKACRQHPHLQRKEGFLVSITKNTWVVMMQISITMNNNNSSSNKKRQKLESHQNDPLVRVSETDNSDAKEGKSQDQRVWKNTIVPKRGSTLSLLIPIPSSEADASEPPKNDKSADEKEHHIVIDMQEDP